MKYTKLIRPVSLLLALLFILCLLPTAALAAEVAVTSWSALQSAINSADGQTAIKLTEDVIGSDSSEPIRVTIGKNIILDLNGHTIDRHRTAVHENGHVLVVQVGATLTIRDSSGTDAGRITGGWAYNGGGIHNSGTLTIAGGTITGNKVANGRGGGIANFGTLKMTGGVISNNIAAEAAGISSSKSGSTVPAVTLENVAIIGNKATGSGGAIRVWDGTVTLKSGTLSGNEAQYGGAVQVEETGVLNLFGGTISANRATVQGGAILVIQNGGTVNIQGNPVVAGNSADSGNNILLRPGKKLTLTGALTAGAKLGVVLEGGVGVFTSGYKTYMGSAAPGTYFVSDCGNPIGLSGGEAAFSPLSGDTLNGYTVRFRPAGRNTNSALCINGNNTEDDVQLYWIGDSHRFYLTKAGSDSYYIRAFNGSGDANPSEGYLDLKGDNVHSYKTKNGSDATKKWRFIQRSDGTYYIQNASTGKYWAMKDSGDSNGNRLIQSGSPQAFEVEILTAPGGKTLTSDFKAVYDSYTFTTSGKTVTGANWMSCLPDWVSVTDLAIPGTHDAATQKTDSNHYAQCQQMSILDELNAGVRYLDLRLNLTDGKLIMTHNGQTCYFGDSVLQWDTVWGWIDGFLTRNPGETVFLQLMVQKGDVAAGDQKVYEFFKNKLSTGRIYQGEFFPTLGQARGKVILLSRLSAYKGKQSSFGTGAGQWAVDCGDWKTSKDYSSVLVTSGATYEVWDQDDYSMENKQKWKHVTASIFDLDDKGLGAEDRIEAAAKKGKRALVVDYTSASQTPFENPQDIARRINRDLLKTLRTWRSENPGKRIGVVVSDFTDAQLARAVYHYNFSSYNDVTPDTTVWSDGFYAVSGNVTVSDRITVTGEVSLYLCDGATLTAARGIHVAKGATLVISAQALGTGKLVATATDHGAAGIGGDSGDTGGVIGIVGGTVEARGGSGGAGIGGGLHAKGGGIMITGGTVTATGGSGGAGIGGGYGGTSGSIRIIGGKVTATGGDSASGIGAGDNAGTTSVTKNLSSNSGLALVAQGDATANSYTVNNLRALAGGLSSLLPFDLGDNEDEIILGWSDKDDYIEANGGISSDVVRIDDDSYFYDVTDEATGDGNYYYFGNLSQAQIDAIRAGSKNIRLSPEGFPEKFDLGNVYIVGEDTARCFVTPVRDQAPFRAGWSFAATAAAESSLLGKNLLEDTEAYKTLDLSEKQMAYFANWHVESGSQAGEGLYSVYGLTHDTVPAEYIYNGGTLFQAAHSFAAGIGPANESRNDALKYRNAAGTLDPDGDWTLEESQRFVSDYVLAQAYRLSSPAGGDPEAISDIKQQLMNRNAVSVGYCDDEVDWNASYAAHFTAAKKDATHAVTIVGWDDAFPAGYFNETPADNGAWLVKDSRGTGRGVNGYFWLSYYDQSVTNPEVLVFDSILTMEKNSPYRGGSLHRDQYDLMPAWATVFSASVDEVKSANVFTAERDEHLMSISYEIARPDTEVYYEVYLLAEGYTSPTDGVLMVAESQTYDHAGFYMEALNAAPIRIQQGQSYSIIVTQRLANGNYCVNTPAALGKDADLVKSGRATEYGVAVVNPGESFLYKDAAWYDWSEKATQAMIVSALDPEMADYFAQFGKLDLQIDNFPIKGYAFEKPSSTWDANVRLAGGAKELNVRASEGHTVRLELYGPDADKFSLSSENVEWKLDHGSNGDAPAGLVPNADGTALLGGNTEGRAILTATVAEIGSVVVPVNVTSEGDVAAPVFSVAEGDVSAGTAVAISCATPGAEIYYTTDGSTPWTGSTRYTGPITVNESITITAIAVKPGWTCSGVFEAHYEVPEDNGGGYIPYIPDGGASGAPAATGKPDNPFVDVAEDSYYYDAVLWAVENGVTTGTDETHFSPDAPCSRAQMVTFLWRAAGSPEPAATENPFEDVDENAYYYKAVLWAAERGITKGTGEGKFSPDATVNRGQTVTFLFRALGGTVDGTEVTPFHDVHKEDFFAEAVTWAYKNGITLGTGADTFSPDADCVRAQIVTFLCRAYHQ